MCTDWEEAEELAGPGEPGERGEPGESGESLVDTRNWTCNLPAPRAAQLIFMSDSEPWAEANQIEELPITIINDFIRGEPRATPVVLEDRGEEGDLVGDLWISLW